LDFRNSNAARPVGSYWMKSAELAKPPSSRMNEQT